MRVFGATNNEFIQLIRKRKQKPERKPQSIDGKKWKYT